MYFKLGRYEEALSSYETVLETNPNRFNSLYGVARSAELSGDLERAEDYYSQLVEMAADESTRKEVEQARTFLALE